VRSAELDPATATRNGWTPCRCGTVDGAALSGGSYGGYAALVGITVTPDKFADDGDAVGVGVALGDGPVDGVDQVVVRGAGELADRGGDVPRPAAEPR